MKIDGDTIILTRDEYEDLIDGARYDAIMRAVAAGEMDMLTDIEADAYFAAPTPLAFWRAKRGLTQQQLADAAGVSQPHIAQLEAGKRDATPSVYAKLAKRLRVRIEDLLIEEEE